MKSAAGRGAGIATRLIGALGVLRDRYNATPLTARHGCVRVLESSIRC